MEASYREFERLLQTGMAGPYEKEYFHKDGSRVWMMFVAADVGDGTLIEYAIDISDRKRAEEARRESDERYRTLFNSIDEGFCTLEVLFDDAAKALDYRSLEVNPAFGKQTGLQNAVGKTMRELAPHYEEFWFETFGRIARSGEAMRFQHGAAALERFFDVYAFRIGEPGENRLGIIFSDISERRRAEFLLRESEERLRALIQNLPGGAVFVLDRELRYLLAEGEALEQTGQPRLLQHHWLHVRRSRNFFGRRHHPPDDLELDMATANRVTSGELPGYSLEKRYIRKDGREVWVSLTSMLVRDGEGQPGYALAIIEDISERREAEDALRESEEHLRLVVESVTEYAIITSTRGD